MALGKLVGETTGKVTLKKLVRQACKQTRKEEILGPDSLFRASGLAYICPREEVLAARAGLSRAKTFSPDAIFNFGYGTALHRQLQDDLLPRAGCLIGLWKCLHCAHVVGRRPEGEVEAPKKWYVKRPTKCPKCDHVTDLEDNEAEDWKYVEDFYCDSSCGITGHPDGFLIMPGRRDIGLLEVKSIGQQLAHSVKSAPRREHVIQANVYMWMTGVRWAIVLYWVKGLYGLSCLKEHLIERDEAVIKSMKDLVQSIRCGLRGGDLPDRVCVKKECPRADSCAVSGECWEDKDASGEPEAYPF